MPLPLLLLGAAVAAGGSGIFKGASAKKLYGESKEIAEHARLRYGNARRRTRRQGKATDERLASLGQLKLETYDTDLRAFVTAFSQIKNAELSDLTDPDVLGAESLSEMDIRLISFSAIDATKAAVAAGGGGAAAGMATFSAVGALGTASTGTAIGALSGAAATNATLAWLGGGSLAAGGAGVTGGMFVLGGVLAGPLVAVGGFVLDAQAKRSLERARATAAEVEAAEAQLDAMKAVASAIERRAADIEGVLVRLRSHFESMLQWTAGLVQENSDYRLYDAEARAKLAVATSTAITLRNLLDVPLLTSKGTVTRRSHAALKRSRDAVAVLENVAEAA